VKERRNRTKAIVAKAVTALVMLAGCADPGDVRTLIVAVDLSDQTEEKLTQYASTLFTLQRQLDRNDRLVVITFWHETNVLYEGPRISGRNSFNKRIASFFDKPREQMRIPGTRTELVFKSIAQVIESASGTVTVAILTDGGVEDQSDRAMSTLHSAIEEIASAQKVRSVAALGVHPWFRELWQNWLKPLESRAIVRGANDMRIAAERMLAEQQINKEEKR
jgi:hypothetical protein